MCGGEVRLPGILSSKNLRGNPTGMYIHTFLFQWKAGVSAANKERAAKNIRAFQGQIPGLLETSYNANQSARSQGFSHGGVMKFKDAAALEAYFAHPVHQKLVEWLMPLLKVAAELDYEM
jgi:stress responsive alpha/beta barrel protein